MGDTDESPPMFRHGHNDVLEIGVGLNCMTDPRLHHYVSAWLLRRFTDSDGFVWWWSKKLSNGAVKKGKPEVVFRKRDLNARVLDDGTLDQETEKAMQSLDGAIAPIADKLIDQGLSECPPDLTTREKHLLDYFLYVQFKRSPEWRTEEMEREVYRDLTGDELPNGVPPRIGAHSVASASSHARSILQNDFASSLLLENSEIAEILHKKGLLICRVPRGEALVVGTTVVVSAGADARTGRLQDSRRGLAFPLASEILLCVGNTKDVREFCDLSVQQVQTINKQIAKHSFGIAGQSSELVCSALSSR